MSYLSPIKRKRASHVRHLKIAAFVFVVAGLSWFFDSQLFEKLTSADSYLANRFDTFATYFEDKAQLERENERLRAELLHQEAVERNGQWIHDRYEDLLREVGLNQSGVVVPVVKRPPYAAYDTYVIRSREGVRTGQLVVSDGVYVIGYVDQVSGEFARVRLFSSPGEEVVVSLDGSLYRGLGQGGGVVELSLPRSRRESTGERVELPSAPTYILGSVVATDFDPQDAFVRGQVVLGPNVYQDDFVTLLEEDYVPTQPLLDIEEDEEDNIVE